MRGLRAATLALVAIAVFAAGILPACAADGCCVKDGDASLHRAMPCCDEPTVVSGEAVSASVPPQQQAPVPVAAIAAPPPSLPDPPLVQATLAVAASAHGQPDLFLRNEQFRI